MTPSDATDGLNEGVVASVTERLRRLEGVVPWMYLDVVGLVTVGVGHLLRTPEEACALPFVTVASAPGEVRAPASPDDVRGNWLRVKRSTPAMLASHYQQFSSVILSSNDVDSLLGRDVEGMWSSLIGTYPPTLSYPGVVQAVLLEMAFSLGVTGLLRYRKMLDAMQAGDWETAAAECHRRSISETRNEETANLIRSAVNIKRKDERLDQSTGG